MRVFTNLAVCFGILSAVFGVLVPGRPARAQDTPRPTVAAPVIKAVLELYTSQGCSSCPAADALLKSYTERSDIVALTMPVDYWDYLGWKDTFANPKYSARQRQYAKKRGDGRIYTPQIVVNGLHHAVGNSQRDIDHAIAEDAAHFAKGRIPIGLRLEQGRLIIEAGVGQGGDVKEATIWLAMVMREAEVTVRGGENRGKVLKYYNVVRELTPIGMWTGKPITIRLERDTVKQSDTDRCAVIIQSGKAGPVLGAALLDKL